MFGFDHAKKAGTAVPRAMMGRESSGSGSTGVSTSGSAHLASGDSALSSTSSLAAGPDSIAESLDFKVQYTLGEYVAFMWQHSAYLIRRHHITGLSAVWMTTKSTWGAAFNFIMLRRSRHVYEFTIDPHGIVRTNKAGVTLVPWADVSAIRRYSRGYMMVLKRGTLPIPYRCLDKVQIQTMNRFVAAVRQAARQ